MRRALAAAGPGPVRRSAAVEQAHPDVPIIAGALDRALDDRKYILPGLGDIGDRLHGM